MVFLSINSVFILPPPLLSLFTSVKNAESKILFNKTVPLFYIHYLVSSFIFKMLTFPYLSDKVSVHKFQNKGWL